MQDILDIVSTVQYLSKTWRNMKQRCENPKNSAYHNYGGRGIKICGGWESKEQFVRDNFDTFPGIGLGYSIERVDVDGNYEPSNCTWATKKEQARNKRNNTKITFRGKDYSAITALSEELSKELGIDSKTIEARIYNYEEALHGTDFESHVTKPVEISSKRIPVQFEGRSFPSKNQASEATGISRTTVTQRMQRYGVDFDEAAKMSPRQNWENPNASPIKYKGVTYPTHRALAKVLGIAPTTITARASRYNESVHGSWDDYISAPVVVANKEVTLFGQTFPTVVAAAKHFNVPEKSLGTWLQQYTPDRVEQEITDHGNKPKRGIRSKIVFRGVEYNQSSLAKFLGTSQQQVGLWKSNLTPEAFQDKIEAYYQSKHGALWT
jgi:biotin operon repressor/DNA-binding XRE family transcriptional regulator